jgi:hypothetical protein
MLVRVRDELIDIVTAELVQLLKALGRRVCRSLRGGITVVFWKTVRQFIIKDFIPPVGSWCRARRAVGIRSIHLLSREKKTYLKNGR